MEGKESKKRNKFLLRTKEDGDLNQYWYSLNTIDAMVKEVMENAKVCAFLSTPSVYFSLPKKSELRTNSKVFDLDKRFKKDPGFVEYDFNKPDEIPKEIHGKFDYVVIDPPFITEEVLTLYAKAAKLLLQEEGKILISTLVENAAIVKKLYGGMPCKFQPSIPKLVYQYNFYTNYEASALKETNPEIAG
uniref:N6-adenine methyltransferase n=1 Tax=Bigelowiella natans TaxID=227086 RepID=A0A6T7IIE5_BIGNA|mmetsp:Transcript_169/g.238  ORF Transcript_169/g.238 Transcript_169/m.238 type:complete len:189 (+) Transcript_169:35-601(+)